MAKKKKGFGFLQYLFQLITITCFRIYLSIKYKITLEGMDNLPSQDDGNYIIVSNHISYNDIPLISCYFRTPLAFIAKKELFDMPLLGLWITLCGTIKVNREKLESSTIKQAKAVLNSPKWWVAVFIEGTRSKIEGQLGKPNNGPMYIARLCKKQIVPVGISYKKNNEVVVTVGEPFMPNLDNDLDDESWKCLEKIAKLSGHTMPPR